MNRMNFDSLKKALLAGTLILPGLTLQVMAAPPSLMAPVSDNITAYPPDPTLASFYINYVDASGATIDYQVIRYPSEGTAVLDQADLNIPDGFYLNEWGEYYAEPGAWNYMDLQVIPNDPALAAALSSADGLSTDKAILTINYYDEGWNLIDSQSFGQTSAGGYADSDEVVMVNGVDYVFDVPEGYQIISDAYDAYSIPMHQRFMTNIIVAPAGEAAYLADTEITEVESEPTTEDTSDTEDTSVNTVDTAVGFNAILAVTVLGLSGSAMTLLKKKKN